MTDTPNGETVVVGQVENEAQTSTSTVSAADYAELKKRAEQSEMRARQLENADQARKQAEEVKRQKQLEENNEFKTLYERTQEQLESLKKEREEESVRQELNSAREKIFSEYPSEVLELAGATGLTLSSNDDESKAKLKEKLDLIKSKVVTATPKKVTGNNGMVNTTSGDDADKSKMYARMRYSDTKLSSDAKMSAINKLGVLDVMRKNAGLDVE